MCSYAPYTLFALSCKEFLLPVDLIPNFLICALSQMSEDCLVLNVNVPATVDLSDASAPPSEKLPVLVWFHGGFFFRGRATTTKYDGRWLSSAINAIVVTVNYRLGKFVNISTNQLLTSLS